jgi:hypothetical protein
MIEELVERRERLVDHLEVNLLAFLGAGRPGQHSDGDVLAALPDNDTGTGFGLKEVYDLEHSEPAISSDGKRDLAGETDRDREFGTNPVFEPANHLLSQLASASGRDRCTVTDLQDLGAEISLSFSFLSQKCDDLFPPLEESLQHT